MLDLHGHPEFNVFAPWEPPKSYVNSYAWRASDPYHDLVRDPQNAMIPKLPKGTQLRYAEIRALVGGVTAIQGASFRSRATSSRWCATLTAWSSVSTAPVRSSTCPPV